MTKNLKLALRHARSSSSAVGIVVFLCSIASQNWKWPSIIRFTCFPHREPIYRCSWTFEERPKPTVSVSDINFFDQKNPLFRRFSEPYHLQTLNIKCYLSFLWCECCEDECGLCVSFILQESCRICHLECVSFLNHLHHEVIKTI